MLFIDLVFYKQWIVISFDITAVENDRWLWIFIFLLLIFFFFFLNPFL